jgi:hypothetical protein
MWKVEVPKLALKQRFLMHSLFSVTALHMASAQLENQISYVDIAIQHHNIAIREYSSNLNGINRENSAALFTCATLIVVSALNIAVTRPHKELKGPVDDILSIFMLLRGVQVVLAEMWPCVEESEIAPIFKGRDVDNTTELSDDIDSALRGLEDRSQSTADADGNSATYSLTIRGLKECFKRVSSKGSDNGMALSWPIIVGPAYIALLASRQPMALLILAHYAIILDGIKDIWWAGGWGKQLVEDIDRMVDDDWKTLIAWPMAKVGAINST